MTDWTPDTTAVRSAWLESHPFPLSNDVNARFAEFDRWLTEHDRLVKAQAFREAAANAREAWAPETCGWVGWLDDRAAQFEAADV